MGIHHIRYIKACVPPTHSLLLAGTLQEWRADNCYPRNTGKRSIISRIKIKIKTQLGRSIRKKKIAWKLLGLTLVRKDDDFQSLFQSKCEWKNNRRNIYKEYVWIYENMSGLFPPLSFTPVWFVCELFEVWIHKTDFFVAVFSPLIYGEKVGIDFIRSFRNTYITLMYDVSFIYLKKCFGRMEVYFWRYIWQKRISDVSNTITYV